MDATAVVLHVADRGRYSCPILFRRKICQWLATNLPRFKTERRAEHLIDGFESSVGCQIRHAEGGLVEQVVVEALV